VRLADRHLRVLGALDADTLALGAGPLELRQPGQAGARTERPEVGLLQARVIERIRGVARSGVGGGRRLASLAGVVPGAFDRPAGCLLSPRCPYVRERCRSERPPLFEVGASRARCFYPLGAEPLP
jgi:hypothetical protein